MKNLSNKILVVMTCCMIFLMSVPTAIYCGAPAPNAGGTQIAGTENLGGKAVSVMGDAQNTIVDIAMAAFPLALIVAFAAIMITHNDKKVATLINICKYIIIAAVAIMLTDAGYVLDTIKNILGIN